MRARVVPAMATRGRDGRDGDNQATNVSLGGIEMEVGRLMEVQYGASRAKVSVNADAQKRPYSRIEWRVLEWEIGGGRQWTDLGEHGSGEARSSADFRMSVTVLGVWTGCRRCGTSSWRRHGDVKSERGGEGERYTDERHGHGASVGSYTRQMPLASLCMRSRAPVVVVHLCQIR